MRNSHGFSSSGADVSTVMMDKDGPTPLHRASYDGQPCGTRTAPRPRRLGARRRRVSKEPGWVDSAASGVRLALVRRSCGTCAVPGRARLPTRTCQQRNKDGSTPLPSGVQVVMGSCGTRALAVPRRNGVDVSAHVSQEQGRVDFAASESPRFAAWVWVGYTTWTNILCSHIYPVSIHACVSLCWTVELHHDLLSFTLHVGSESKWLPSRLVVTTR